MLAAIIDVEHLIHVAGYPLLVLLVMSESSGLPVPGETALITASLLASKGDLDITAVIVLAAAAAIVGDNIGYLIGRKGGRWVLERPGRFHRERLRVIATGEPFFERHGPKAVFFGRFVLGLRVWASWLAGATHMRWRSFLLWNALGGICWATIVGLIAYFLGRSAGNALQTFGLFGLGAAALALITAIVLHTRHRRHRRQLAQAAGQSGDADAGMEAAVASSQDRRPPPAPEAAPGD
jgi:membrane protein DedA with SNARE-associated domain